MPDRATITQSYEIAFDDEPGIRTVRIRLSDVLQWELSNRKDWLSDGAPTLAGQTWVVWKACQRLDVFPGTYEDFQERVTTFTLLVPNSDDDLVFPT